MIVEFSVYDTPAFSVEHLFESPENQVLIEKFNVSNDALGLEVYLKEQSVVDETNKMSRTYLVKDKVTGELVGYFSLKTGLITLQVFKDAFESIPAIELANFAVNEAYRRNHPGIKRIGYYIFLSFIRPLAESVGKYIGVNALYIYALPQEKLIEHYRTMGFSRLPPEQEAFVQNHVKPKYDENCIFMYQTL